MKTILAIVIAIIGAYIVFQILGFLFTLTFLLLKWAIYIVIAALIYYVVKSKFIK